MVAAYHSCHRSILRIHKEEPGAKDAIYFADRSPFSALFYARNGHLMEINIKSVPRARRPSPRAPLTPPVQGAD